MRQFKLAVAVGTAVFEPGRHRVNPFAMRHGLKRQIQNAANSAHTFRE
jgi:hypothetical protein